MWINTDDAYFCLSSAVNVGHVKLCPAEVRLFFTPRSSSLRHWMQTSHPTPSFYSVFFPPFLSGHWTLTNPSLRKLSLLYEAAHVFLCIVLIPGNYFKSTMFSIGFLLKWFPFLCRLFNSCLFFLYICVCWMRGRWSVQCWSATQLQCSVTRCPCSTNAFINWGFSELMCWC